MKIAIIGWYGTETIGDRGILAGLLKSFANAFGDIEIKLGSLYPFFSNRTVNEDSSLWRLMIGFDPQISIFDSSKPSELKSAIQNCELVVMGGGPLMHISELYMVEFAFKYAKKINKKTAVLGCGVGPIFNRRYHRPLLNIIEVADLVILRDKASLKQLEYILSGCNRQINNTITVSLDPAVIACAEFNKLYHSEKSVRDDRICINLRAFPSGYSEKHKAQSINRLLVDFVRGVVIDNPNMEIVLVPMHYFHIGDDDRVFLHHVFSQCDVDNIQVQDIPLDLQQTLELFLSSKLNYGMRFHSVVFQTLVSGNNYILDYTEPNKGKIPGFLKNIDPDGYYKDRYINIQNSDRLEFPSKERGSFCIDDDLLRSTLVTYSEKLTRLFN